MQHSRPADRGSGIDRTRTCPLLLRLFIRAGSHNRVEEYRGCDVVPAEDENHLYTWKDATLRELSDLIKEVNENARLKRARLSFALVYPNAQLMKESDALKRSQSAASASSLEAAAAAADEQSYLQRIYSAATSWGESDFGSMWAEFCRAPLLLIGLASAASLSMIGLQFLRTRATGMLFDAFSHTTAGGGGTNGNGPQGGSPASPHSVLAYAPSLLSLPDPAWPGWALLLQLLLLSIAEWAAAVSKEFLYGQARAARVVQSRVAYFASMLRQDLAFHDGHRSAELAFRLHSDPDAMDDAILFSLERLASGLAALSVGVYIFLTDWQTLALGLALRLPFALQFVERTVQVTSAYDRLQNHTFAVAQARATEALGSVRTLQANTAEAGEVEGYRHLLQRYAGVVASGAAVTSVLKQAEKAVGMLSEVIVLAYGGYRITTGQTTLGRFTAYQAHMGSIVQNFNCLEAFYVGLRQAAIRSRRYFALRDRAPSIGDGCMRTAADSVAAGTESATEPPTASAVASNISRIDGGDAVATIVALRGEGGLEELLYSHSLGHSSSTSGAAVAATSSGSDSVAALAPGSPADGTGAQGLRSRKGRGPPAQLARLHVVPPPPPPVSGCIDAPLLQQQGTLRFQGVSFAYPVAVWSTAPRGTPAIEQSSVAVSVGAGPSGPSSLDAARGRTGSSTPLLHNGSSSMGGSEGSLPVPALASGGGTAAAISTPSGGVVWPSTLFPPTPTPSIAATTPLTGWSAEDRAGVAPPSPPLVLQDITFEARANTTLAIVGGSGCGKSTIARLMLRFFDPVSGAVELNGLDLRSMPLERVRRAVALVDQDSALLDRSVLDNLLLGLDPQALVPSAAPAASVPVVVSSAWSPKDSTPMERRDPGVMQAVIRATTLAHAHDFICGLPQGYDTVLGERGSRLSGGQKQRLQIARAILRDPLVLVLDEATSALDATSESIVSAALDNLMAGRATVIIAHRLGTIRRADQILVMAEGRIVERGTHAGILAAHPNGAYATLLAHQL